MSTGSFLPRIEIGTKSSVRYDNIGTKMTAVDKLQYWLLRRFFKHGPSSEETYYAHRSKVRVVLGDEIIDQLCQCDTVLDFGCAEGREVVDLARAGCRRVVGIDMRPEVLRKGELLAVAMQVAHKCVFATRRTEPVDAIISVDAFEHFDHPAEVLRVMHDLLKPGGRVYGSFGLPWFHPVGGHLFSVFPWAHLIFSETALCTWRSNLRNDGAMRFREVEGGLNQMTIGRFERLVAESPLDIVSIQCVPIRKLRWVHNRWTREFTTAAVQITLKRPILSAEVKHPKQYQLRDGSGN
jgi:SAM-dependent methyltransferase